MSDPVRNVVIARSGVKGWLLVLCLVLIAWQPLSLALVASNLLDALPLRGWSLGALLIVRIFVAAFSIAAGLAIAGRRPAALTLAKTSLALSAATDIFIYLTPYVPSNRMPGDTPFYVAASLVYYSGWMIYLFRSTRVRNTLP